MIQTPTSPAPSVADDPDGVDTRRWWAAGGVVAGVAGLAVSQLAAELLSLRETPLVSVATAISRLSPGSLAQATAEFLLTLARPLLLVVVALLLLGLFAVGGLLLRRSLWAALPVWVLLAAVNLAAALATNGPGMAQVLPVVAGFGVWMVLLGWTDLRVRAYERVLEQRAVEAPSEPDAVDDESVHADPARRGVLVAFGFGVLVTSASGVGSWLVERRRDAVRESRKLLRIPGVTRPRVPAQALVGVEELPGWQTPNDDFFVSNRALRTPTMEASEWSLRIHGRVEREINLTYSDLLARGMSEAWMTVVAASNEVGGHQVGNAWWSGVPTRLLLEEAGVLADADAVVQTSVGGWSCVTPLGPLTDERPAMLAVAMNGEALPLEHGFPVRSVVPGLHSDTASCQWVVEWEVTRQRDVGSTSVSREWDADSPVQVASRVDVPEGGEHVAPGRVRFAGYAWHPGIGIDKVEYAVDGGRWRTARIASPGTDDTWVQWSGSLDLEPGEHAVRVRAVNRHGQVQTGVVRDPAPSGATGWHEVSFVVDDADDD